MHSNASASSEHGQRLQEMLHAYLQACDRGEQPDRQVLLDAHPEQRDELAAYFADESKLRNLAHSLATQQFAPADKALTLDSLSGSAPGGALPRIRYFGDYELLEEIARGGMGVVFKARQVPLNRTVALKMILKGELATEADVRRFHQEAEAAGNLDHPHIVPIYEVGAHQGQHYFSMKLIETQANCGRPSGESQRAIAHRLALVARAVHHAHQRGILHRDLKPSNILIDQRGEPHVADFGLAKKVEGDAGATRSGAIVGTPAYMAPEQARAEKSLTTAVDVYSLGAILYDWLTGQPPFRGPDLLATLRMVVADEPAAPRSIDPKIDRDLETICLKCLEKEPSKRYGSAEALAEELERWLRGEPIVARSVGGAERIWRWCQRNRMLASMTAAIAASLLLGTLVSWLLLLDAREQAGLAQLHAADALAKEQRAVRGEQEAKAQQRAADGMRLIAQAETVRASDPALALLLGIEGAQRYPGLLANNGLIASLEQCQEERTRFLPCKVYGASYGPDGKTILVWGADGAVRMLDAADFRERHWLMLHGRRDVVTAAFSPDGRRIATIGERGYRSGVVLSNGSRTDEIVCTIWDSATGQRLAQQRYQPRATSATHAQRVTAQRASACSIHFQQDGKRFLFNSSYPDVPPRLCETDTGREVRVLTGNKQDQPQPTVVQAALSRDGRYAALVDKLHGISLWDAGTGQLLRTHAAEEGPVQLLFSPDARQMLAIHTLDFNRVMPGAEKSVRCWDTQSGQELWSLTAREAPRLRSAAYSKDGKLLVFAGPTVAVCEAATGKLAVAFRDVYADNAMFNPDASSVAATCFNVVKVWDVAQGGKELLTLRGHKRYLAALAYSPDGQRVLTAGTDFDDDDNSVRLWKATAPTPVDGHWSNVSACLPTPDRKQLLTFAPRGELRLWDTAGKLLVEFQEPGRPDSQRQGRYFSADGKRLGLRSDKHTARVWDTTTGKVLARIDSPEELRACSLSPDGQKLLLLTREEGSIWAVDRAEQLASLQTLHTDFQWGTFSPNGKWLLVESTNGIAGEDLRVFDAATGQDLKAHGEDFPFPIVGLFANDGQSIYYSVLQQLRRRNLDNGQLTVVNKEPCKSQMKLFFSADERRLAGVVEKEIHLWDTHTGKVTVVLRGHESFVQSVEFSADGNLLLSSSTDETKRLWNLRTGQQCATWKYPLSRHALFFSADGRHGFIQTFGGVQRWPLDLVSAARTRKPRELTSAEKTRFLLP